MDNIIKGIGIGLFVVIIICIIIGCTVKPDTPQKNESLRVIEPKPNAPMETELPLSLPSTTVTGDLDGTLRGTEDYVDQNFQAEIEVIAKIIFREARGIVSQVEQACVAWTILNRYDTQRFGKSIIEVATAPHQFAYIEDSPTIDDYGRDLKLLAKDVLIRWCNEQIYGIIDGRVLPKEYLFFIGDGLHNNFTKEFLSDDYWDYSLASPYEAS